MVYSFEPTDWIEDNSSLFTGTISDTVIYSDEPYAFTRFTFYGTQVQLRYRSGPLRTDALITIDGKISDTLDQRFPVYQSGQAWTSPPLELGYHTINVMVSTYAQPDERVAIDGFTVINNPSSTPPATLPTLPLTTTRTISYSYDGLLRLISADASDGDDYAYSYDLAGNRTGVWVNGVRTETKTYNSVNEVVGWTYDDAGNLLDDGTSTYAYDALNRQILQDSTAQVYNGDGVLVQSGRTVYTQDLALPLTQVLQVSDGTNRTNYIYGHQRLMSDAGEWYATDALGSVRLTLDNNGTAYSGATYDPWGSPERGSVGTFGFTGELQQGDNVYLRARWYNANNGTFTSKDPFEGYPQQPYSLHPYQYALSDPLRLVDRSGWCAEDEWQQSTASGCYRFYQDALKSIGLDIDKHKALFLKLDINQFLEISQWGARGLRLYEGNWDSNTVWTIIEALDRVQRAVGGNARLLERMFDLDGRFERQLRFSFRYESSSEGTSAGYAPGVMMGFMKWQKSGALIAKVDSEPVTEHLIIHELGHRFDHIAGGDEYWSSGNVWLNAAGWCFSVTSSTYTLTAEGLQGAVSEYAAHGMAGVMGIRARRYYQKHAKTLISDGWTEADYVANAIKGLEGGNPVEDFAETFAWYIFNKTGGIYGLSGGISNRHNKEGKPNRARLDALIDLIDTFR